MLQFGFDVFFKGLTMSTNLEAKLCRSEWSEEYDCVPLILRSKMLRTKVSKQHHVDADVGVSNADGKQMCDEVYVDRKQDKDHNDKVTKIAKQSSNVTFAGSSGFFHHGSSDCWPHLSSLDNISSNSVDYSGESDLEKNLRVSGMSTAKVPASEVVGEGKPNTVVDVLSHKSLLEVVDRVPIDCSMVVASVHVQAGKLKHETIYEFDDDLDNVVLGERRRMLVSRKLMQSSGSSLVEQNKFEEMSNLSKAAKQTADIEKGFDSNQFPQIAKVSNSLTSVHDHLDSKCRYNKTSRGNTVPLSFELRISPTNVKRRAFDIRETNTTCAQGASSALLSFAKVKDEPVDLSELRNEGNSGINDFFTSSQMLCVKSEPSIFDSLGDELDHLPLIDRVKLILSGSPNPTMDTLDNLESLQDNVDIGTDIVESVQPISISRPSKRRKTATNSVETALEEDAPELLKVLIERGILVDEMKLYGEEDPDGDLDDSLSEDGFTELEAVISQLFTQRQTFLKFPHLRTKGEKVSYCLACLLSLVEQTKFLRNRKWPVEWGWCRDLQSFIFVFPRHNRIVLERPEYGYATYFFELLNSVPAAWQIKRLVTALKLTSCGRITLMENKPLVVGEDLSEGEARVLADYGWTPNTGLGTMLNYCDRVFHDRKQELHRSEWRSKIGKQLMNGYNSGSIVSKNLPENLIEDPFSREGDDDEEVQVKLEQ
ncbi:hypothetical protein RND81_10G065900 [Saponaria officinalis]|uniref:Uncharacterized protein n=1 Tax=Saponaria officinalis TaxID=3572 RepID=A0AAW1HYS1_SAPOF